MMMIPIGIALVIVAILLAQYISNDSQIEVADKEKRKAIPQTARDILSERYANGELTREEYLTMLDDIQANEQHRLG